MIERGFLHQEPEEPSPGNLYEPSSEVVAVDGGFNQEAARRAALKARRVAAAGASMLGLGILSWILLRKVKVLRRS
jgi:cytochrome oxidase assembly protein ShyY1